MHPYRMAWSFRIARLFGIDIRLHIIFLVLIAWLCLEKVFESGSLSEGLRMFFVLFILFGFVLLHELGHSLAAKKAGIRVIDITLWPLGGLARLAGETRDPKTELKIATAGPAVNLGIVLAMLPLVYITEWGDQPLVRFVFLVNLVMGLFNLIPAFPLDGGRILRAIIAFKLPYLKATEIAVFIGKVLALTCIFYSLFTGDMFVISLICIFVIWAGSSELRSVRVREAFGSSGAWGRNQDPIIDGEVVSGGTAGTEHGRSEKDRSRGMGADPDLKRFERDFIDMIRRIRKDGEE